MRYEIKKSQVIPSMFIDAPYDTKADALEDISAGVIHNCQYCDGLGSCPNIDPIKAILETVGD